MRKSKLLLLLVLASAASVAFPTAAAAHEPLFGLGPHSIGQYAWALESGLEGGDDGWANVYELSYGLTPDITVTTALPYLLTNEAGSAGFSDVGIRGKYRFLRRDVLNASKGLALHGGIRFPTGNRLEGRGSSTRDYFAGLSFGHEGRANYAFADVRYNLRGAIANLERGNVLNVDAAYGIRPWKLQYKQPDTVFLVEVIGEWVGKNSVSGVLSLDSGGKTISVAPGVLFSYRNVMLKGGVKFPVATDLNGLQEKPGPEVVFSIDIHMPPFK